MDSSGFRGIGELAMIGAILVGALLFVWLVASVSLPVVAIWLGWHPSTVALCLLPGVVLGILMMGGRR